MSVCWKFIFLVGQLAFTNFTDARTQNETSAHASGYCRNRNVIRVGRSVMRFPSHTFYPADYPRNIDTCWKFLTDQALQNVVISLRFTSFELEYHDDCDFDYIKINCGVYGGDVTRLGKFCGTADFRDAIYSQRNGVFELRFVTDLSIEYSGFVLEVQAIDPTSDMQFCSSDQIHFETSTFAASEAGSSTHRRLKTGYIVTIVMIAFFIVVIMATVLYCKMKSRRTATRQRATFMRPPPTAQAVYAPYAQAEEFGMLPTNIVPPKAGHQPGLMTFKQPGNQAQSTSPTNADMVSPTSIQGPPPYDTQTTSPPSVAGPPPAVSSPPQSSAGSPVDAGSNNVPEK